MNNIKSEPVGGSAIDNHVRWRDFRKRNGRRKKAIRARNEFINTLGIVDGVWHGLPETVRRTWQDDSRDGNSRFREMNITRQKMGLPYVITRESSFYGGDNYIISSEKPGCVSITFTPECRNVNLTIIMQKCTEGLGEGPLRVMKDVYRKRCPIVIRKLESESEYMLYIIATDGSLDRTCSIAESIGCKMLIV